MNSNKVIHLKTFKIIATTILVLVILGYIASELWFRYGPPQIVRDHDGQAGVINELVIIGSGVQVRSAVSQFGGVIVTSIPETDTYRVRFHVSDLSALDKIASELKSKEFQVYHNYAILPSKPGEPQ